MWEETVPIVMQIITLVVMAVGMLSLLTFIVPGLTIVWVGALVYGLVTGFDWVSGILFAIMTILMVLGGISDNIMMGASAREKGASWLAIGVATLAAIIGTVVFPPFGGVIAALVSIYLVEVIRLKEWRKAVESMRGMATGCGWGFVSRFVFGLMMIFLWLLWVYII
ncbi:MAG: DUF456 domain-containing protein, partial [Anaerolineaceae bacterium]